MKVLSKSFAILVVSMLILHGCKGPKGDKGDKGDPGTPCWEIVGDVNNDGKLDANDCVGQDGMDGTNGISCWDLNGNGIGDPEEDINNDGNFDALDCQGKDGEDGTNGISCWDLNGNGIADPDEDINNDGEVDALDCKGADGQDGLACWDLNGNGVGDPEEDINNDGNYNALDCKGADGQDGCYIGTVSGVVKDVDGNLLEGVTITTDPATTQVTTDANGAFEISDINIGVYTLTASLTGYQDYVTQVGVVACQTVSISVIMAKEEPSGPGSISGYVTDLYGNGLEGATVTIENSTISTTTDADGHFVLQNVDAPGPYYLYVTAPAGYLDSETFEAVWVSSGMDTELDKPIKLSGKPTDSATYVGSDVCKGCHQSYTPEIVTDWEGSAHHNSVNHDYSHFDASGWPAAGDQLTLNFTVHAYGTTDQDATVTLIHDTDNNGNDIYRVQIGNDVFDVIGTYGGISNEQYKQRYLFVDTNSNLLDSSSTDGPNPIKILPIQYNQKSGEWVDYHGNKTNAEDNWWNDNRAFGKKCAGCHNTNLDVQVDANGNLTHYSYDELNIGCEKCHGPGSDHASASDSERLKYIIAPDHLTQKAATELCGRCHSRGHSADPDGAYGYPWNDSLGGEMIPALGNLDDFYVQTPGLWGDAVGHSKKHHQQYNDLLKAKHYNNPYDKVTCYTCHNPHKASVGPDEMEEDGIVFHDPDVDNNVLCLVCHAEHGDFANITKEDVAMIHTSYNGNVTDTAGNALTYTDDEIADAQETVEEAVELHMTTRAAMPAGYDPDNGPGRCIKCHMPKTAKSAEWFTGPNIYGQDSMIEGDIHSHVFDIIRPQISRSMAQSASSNTDIMPNSCGTCHDRYRFAAP